MKSLGLILVGTGCVVPNCLVMNLVEMYGDPLNFFFFFEIECLSTLTFGLSSPEISIFLMKSSNGFVQFDGSDHFLAVEVCN